MRRTTLKIKVGGIWYSIEYEEYFKTQDEDVIHRVSLILHQVLKDNENILKERENCQE